MSNCSTSNYNDVDRLMRLTLTEEYYTKVFKILEPLDLVDSRKSKEIEFLLKKNHLETNYVDYILRKEM